MQRKAFNTANSGLLLETFPASSNPQKQCNYTDSVDRNVSTTVFICNIVYAGGGSGGRGGVGDRGGGRGGGGRCDGGWVGGGG